MLMNSRKSVFKNIPAVKFTSLSMKLTQVVCSDKEIKLHSSSRIKITLKDNKSCNIDCSDDIVLKKIVSTWRIFSHNIQNRNASIYSKANIFLKYACDNSYANFAKPNKIILRNYKTINTIDISSFQYYNIVRLIDARFNKQVLPLRTAFTNQNLKDFKAAPIVELVYLKVQSTNHTTSFGEIVEKVYDHVYLPLVGEFKDNIVFGSEEKLLDEPLGKLDYSRELTAIICNMK